MKYLITGGAGFIGSYLSEYLLDRGESVTVIDDLSTGNIKNLDAVIDHPNFKLIIATVFEENLLESLIREADCIYHLASAVGVRLIMEEPVKTIDTIFRGTEVVLRYGARYRKKVFISSTSEIYGKSNDVPFREDGDRLQGPTHLHRWAYACAKSLDEFLALAYAKVAGLPVVVGRLFNTVGARQSSQYGMVLPRFVEAALLEKNLPVYGDGTQTRCFCHVSDVVRALYLLMNSRNCENQVFNIGSDKEISIYDLANRVVELTGSSSKVKIISYDRAFPKGGFEDMQRRVPCLERINHMIDWKPQYDMDAIIMDVIKEKKQLLGLI